MPDDKKQNITESVNPALAAIRADLDSWRQAYWGGPGYTSSALHQHGKEDPGDFTNRLQRATYLQYLKPICKVYSEKIFAPEWGIKYPENAKYLETNANKSSQPLIEFFKYVAPYAVLYGYYGIGVDSPATDMEPLTQQELKDAGIQPYLYGIAPQDLQDWSCDADGKFEWVMVRETVQRRAFTGDGVEDQSHEVFRVWTPEWCFRYDSDGDLIGEPTPNPIGRVPIVILQFEDEGRAVIGRGLGQDLAPIQSAILNRRSLRDEMAHLLPISQLFAPGASQDYSTKDGKASNTGYFMLGTAKVVLYPVDATHPPMYLSPEIQGAEFLSQEDQDDIKEMYRTSCLKMPDVEPGGPAESGIARALRFVDTNQALRGFSRNLQSVMKSCIEMVSVWMDHDPTPNEVEVTPPVDFGILDPRADAELYETLNTGYAPKSHALNVALMKSITAGKFPGNVKLLKAVEADLGTNEMPTELPPEPPAQE